MVRHTRQALSEKDQGERDALLSLPTDVRWIPGRKARIVAAVNAGIVTMKELTDRYEISVEEFSSWRRSIRRHGIPGLRVTRLQIYRDAKNITENVHRT